MGVTVGFRLRQFPEIFKIRNAAGQPYILIGGQAVIRVLDPVALLACKLELAATVSRQKRRDVEHLRILLPCVRSFVGELLRQVELDQLPARDWLKVANQALKLTTSMRARKTAGKHQINWPDILPLTAIARCQHEKIRRFQEQQLEKGYKKSKGIST